MPTANLTQISQQTCGSLFEFYKEFLVAGDYHRGGSSPVSIKFLVMPLPAALLYGNKVDANDEQVFIAAADMGGMTLVQPGDYLVETVGGLRRDVITAHADMTRTLWILIARRVFT